MVRMVAITAVLAAVRSSRHNVESLWDGPSGRAPPLEAALSLSTNVTVIVPFPRWRRSLRRSRLGQPSSSPLSVGCTTVRHYQSVHRDAPGVPAVFPMSLGAKPGAKHPSNNTAGHSTGSTANSSARRVPSPRM
jgi:hypothetical protein